MARRRASGARSRTLAAAAALATVATTAVVTLAAGASPAGAATASAKYTVTTLHFEVHVGPDRATTCDVVGDLYKPVTANSTHRVPAILTTNGFGGSKDDQAGIGKYFASHGYVVLSYSGLGFGGSGCQITLDDPDWDGRAASQLVGYLGGAPGVAFTDAAHTKAAGRLLAVIHDARDHLGVKRAYDPRVGMIGGSYGGEIQFAAADDDARVDTLVPLITWNDLSYSLAPNNANPTSGVSTANPGAVKLTWGVFFTADGMLNGVQQAQGDPNRLAGCPNFAMFVCPALVTGGSAGYFQDSDNAAFKHASVVSYMSHIRIPTLLMQGENDTLFNLNEAAATYQALRAQHVPVRMVWQSWGHSNLTPAPGELDLSNPNPATQYETRRIVDWFAHWLQDKPTPLGPAFSYFRDWVGYKGIATPAYATANRYPVGTPDTFYLSGGNAPSASGGLPSSPPSGPPAGTLVSDPAQIVAGDSSFATPPAGPPSSVDPIDVAGSYLPSGKPGDDSTDAPGTAASWTSAPLASNLDVAGSPTLDVTLSAPVDAQAQAAGPAGQLVLFAKVFDVDSSGTAHLIRSQVAPMRVADAGKPVHVVLPAIVHRFAAGDSIRVVLSGGSANYRGGLTPTPVTVSAGPTQKFTLPVVGD